MTEKQLKKLTAEAHDVGLKHANQKRPGAYTQTFAMRPKEAQAGLMKLVAYALEHQPKNEPKN